MRMNGAKFSLDCKNRTGNKKIQRTRNRTDQVNSSQFERDRAIQHVWYVRKFCFKRGDYFFNKQFALTAESLSTARLICCFTNLNHLI